MYHAQKAFGCCGQHLLHAPWTNSIQSGPKPVHWYVYFVNVIVQIL